jgi:hypothetical protein
VKNNGPLTLGRTCPSIPSKNGILDEDEAAILLLVNGRSP